MNTHEYRSAIRQFISCLKKTHWSCVVECVEVCGVTQVKGKMRKGSKRWCEEVSVAVAEKIRA